MVELPIEVITQGCRWTKNKQLIESTSLICRSFFSAAHILLHEENKHIIDSLHFEKDDDRCLVQSKGQTHYAPIPEVDLPANIEGVLEISFSRIDEKIIKFLHLLDPLLRKICLHIRALHTEHAEKLMEYLGERVCVLYTDFDDNLSDYYEKFKHVLNNVYSLHLVLSIEEDVNSVMHYLSNALPCDRVKFCYIFSGCIFTPMLIQLLKTKFLNANETVSFCCIIEESYIEEPEIYTFSLENKCTHEKFVGECNINARRSGKVILRRLIPNSPKWNLMEEEINPDINKCDLPFVLLEVLK